MIDFHLVKKDEYFELTTTIETNQGLVTVKSKVVQPFLQINQTSDTSNDLSFGHAVLNKQASFHLNADVLVDPKTNTLFTLAMDEKRKTHLPKKHKKHNKNSTRKK
jgi:hypothetical protein